MDDFLIIKDGAFPLLSALVFLPLTGALVLLLSSNDNFARVWSLLVTLVTALVSLQLYFGFDPTTAKFQFAESTLPYYPDVPGAPQNTIIGGASLWVMAGKPADHYKGVAKFFEYLSSPQVQAASHQRTGYLPITLAAFELTEKSGFYKKNPGTDVAVNQMIRKTTDKSRGVRLGNFVQIRAIVDEETEQIWTGKKTAKEALDAAVSRGNELLTKFQAANK